MKPSKQAPSRAGASQTRPVEKLSTVKAVETLLKAPVEPAANSHTEITAEELHRMISNSAYLRAEKRGFETGHELEDWLAAESEIKQQLGQVV